MPGSVGTVGARAVVRGPGTPVEIEEFEPRSPGPDEVLVRMDSSGLNHLDLWVTRGLPGITYPVVPGCDGIGTVAEAGAAVTTLALGDTVILSPGIGDPKSADYGIHGEHTDGAHATHVTRPADLWLKAPAEVDKKAAGCFALAYLTAFTMVVRRAATRRGETVFVWGGASGVGHAAGEIARGLGARTVTTARGAKAKAIAGLGWEAVLDPDEDDVVDALREVSPGGADVVVEHVGAATWKRSLSILARNGRLVTCGATTGNKVEVDLAHLFIKNQSLLGSTMGTRADLDLIAGMLADGEIAPLIDETFPLARLGEAHERLADGAAVGKVVIDLS